MELSPWVSDVTPHHTLPHILTLHHTLPHILTHHTLPHGAGSAEPGAVSAEPGAG